MKNGNGWGLRRRAMRLAALGALVFGSLSLVATAGVGHRDEPGLARKQPRAVSAVTIHNPANTIVHLDIYLRTGPDDPNINPAYVISPLGTGTMNVPRAERTWLDLDGNQGADVEVRYELEQRPFGQSGGSATSMFGTIIPNRHSVERWVEP